MRKATRWRIVGGLLVAGSVVFLILAITGAGGGSAPTGELQMSMQSREYIMSGVYKVYALKDKPAGIWVAKTIFENKTSGVIRDLKVRYRLEGFSDWSSWQVHKCLVPSQTVVDTYYPLLSATCGKQENRATTELKMEYEYTDAAGKSHSDSASKRLTMLGIREIVYRTMPLEEVQGQYQEFFVNSPLTAAWVTPDDKAAGGLAALANERALGAGASTSDENCIKVMTQAYEMMRAINITYQSPGGGGANIGEKSFDPLLVQSVQYPRDTIRKRTGTCIELAILYASMLKSQGIKPYLVMLPGHCFPIGELPTSGSFLPVEATCVGGGGRNSQDFAKAVEVAQKEWADLQKSGDFILVDVEACIEMGIVPPDLEPLPDDILQRWKITEMAAGKAPGGQGGGGGGGGGVAPPAGGIQPGNWRATVSNGQSQIGGSAHVQVSGAQVSLVFSLQYSQTDMNGVAHSCEEVDAFAGTIQGNALNAECRQATWKMDGQAVPPRLPIRLQLQTSPDGRTAQGMVAGVNGQAQVSMQWSN